jgi:hypothetical protein
MPHPLDSAHERLKRADEQIKNLNIEISEFLAPIPVVTFFGREPIVTDENRQAYRQLQEFISHTEIPPRFSVLAGEIVHHLRSAFDHVAWELSSDAERRDHATRIEFPIFPDALDDKGKLTRFERKIEGISSPTALACFWQVGLAHFGGLIWPTLGR